MFLSQLLFSIYAQRVNEHGLKIVCEVEVYWKLEKILLKYNEQNRLVGVII